MAASMCDGITGTNTATELNKQAKAIIDALPLVGNHGGQER